MEYRNLGRWGVRVSSLCLGTGFRDRPDEDVCHATINRAIDHGINFIDCANQYQGGLSERIVGKALQGRRDEFVLTSKVCHRIGTGPNDGGLSRFHVMREIENSLSRLGTDRIDIYFAHDNDPRTPIEETLRAFDDLVRQGKVRYVGCSNFAAWQVCKALWVSDRSNLTPFACVQDRYNLLNRGVERELMPLCRAEGLGMLAYSALAIGLLTGRFRRGEPPPPGTYWAKKPDRFDRAMTPEVDRALRTLVSIAAERGKTPAQVAISWLLSRPGVSSAIIGPESPEQVDENVGALGWNLSEVEISKLHEVSSWTITAG